MSFETDTGPLTTADEAWVQLELLLDAFPSARPKAGTIARYVEVMCQLPKRYVEAAVESLTGEGREWVPNPGQLEAEVRGIWPMRDYTGKGCDGGRSCGAGDPR